MYAAVSAMNGSPYKIHGHDGVSDDQLWSLIKSHDMDSDIMTAASHFCGSDSETNDQGVACSHAYTVISCGEFQNGGETVRLIKVRNPWGSEQYAGDYSDDSWKWTPELRAAVEAELGDAAVSSNEGIFFMDIASYKRNFQLTVVNQDTRNWNLDYFLKLDDPTDGYHTIEVTNDSSSAQQIYVGAHVWQDRTYGWYNWQCQEAMWSSTKHVLSGDSIPDCRFDADTGACWTDSLTFAAGETKTFQVSLDWSRTNIARDFSVTAWGTSGDVSVRCADGMETDHMPQYTDDKSNVDPPVPIPDDGEEEGGDNGECQNLDEGLYDPDGDNCTAYEGWPAWCEQYEFPDFKPKELCCVCGGGYTPDGGDGDEVVPDEDGDDEVVPDEDGDDEVVPDEGEEEQDGGDGDGDGDDTIPEFVEIFVLYDVNGDGVLSIEEFTEIYNTYCGNCPFESAQAMYDNYKNSAGEITIIEFESVYECPGFNEDDTTPTPDPTPAPTPEPTPDSEFDAWVAEQQVPETEYYCFAEIHNEWNNGYNFFAGHDCEIYDLTLTVMARKTDWDQHLTNISSDAEQLGCEDIGTFDRACRFLIHPTNNKLGIRFDSTADVDLYYETEWQNCIENM